MLFEWGREQAAAHVSDHGVDFVDMVQVFDGRPTFTYRSPRNDEDRWGIVAIVQDRFYLVVWTPRGGRRRIISAYRADDWEIRGYRALHG
jgi:uncharacterized DUF497 family protein